MRALLGDAGEVVTRDELAAVGWPDETPTRNAVDLRVMRLRRRVEPLGVMIRTVRGRGYVVDEF
jgi:DNA-binding response OmpR family regulator